MPLPSRLTFNELNGDEAKQILIQRYTDLLNHVPWLQRHLTLPRVRMSLDLRLEMYADQPTPEVHHISNDLVIDTDQPIDVAEEVNLHLTDAVNAAPTPGGRPPDRLREEHQIHIPKPVMGDRSIGGHVVLVDSTPPAQPPPPPKKLDGEVVEEIEGLSVDRTCSEFNATVVKQDFGPAGLNRGGQREQQLRFGRK
jgi:hypothetical protein